MLNSPINLSTSSKFEIVNITHSVEKLLKDSKILDGVCNIFIPHATACVTLNEDEPNLKQDIIAQIKANFSLDNYKHDLVDDNAQAHLAASFIGSNITIPIKDGILIKGTWQEVLFVELDGPRSQRQAIVSIY
jgi:secondary thiamine-phosphate synthase enzyme